ncbi:MAG: alpha-L-arabinofuranosidase [Sphingobacteriia bacterium]|nr:alpha-L-arabinofuranosidase [Sphingobacteriia bacterium]
MQKTLFYVLFFLQATCLHAQDYVVDPGKILAKIPATLWGIFYEDINRAGDGGLYAELIKNNSFDFPKPMTAWSVLPAKIKDGVFVVVNQRDAHPDNPRYLSVTLAGDSAAIVNEGFGGIEIKKGLRYHFTLRYREPEAGVHLQVSLQNTKGDTIALSPLQTTIARDWQTLTLDLVASDTAHHGKLVLYFYGKGKIDIDRLSLFPADTWRHKPGGLRKDLVEKLAALHPSFMRFPGGCIVEGKNLDYRYQWKQTIGPLENRRLLQSIWNDDVALRQTPDYFQSFGLGFYEYFELCEQIGATPVPILNCGMSCQFDAAEVVPLSELDPYIQDALDLIEFANGDITTRWGAKRAKLGHPKPFGMRMLGIGNENWGPQYAERLSLFTQVIKKRYPEIRLINATGYSPRQTQFIYMDSVLRARHADIIDEHFYNPPDWFFQNSNRYDGYDRHGPKIFVGEYAAQSDKIGSLHNKNNLLTALAETAFMIGIERNCDIVSMAAYAPLFAHVDDWQWTPNLIWFDNAGSYQTPNYYVQQLFSVNAGTKVVSMTLNGKTIQGQDSIWASAVIDEGSSELICKLVNAGGSNSSRRIRIGGNVLAAAARVITLSGHPTTENSLAQPNLISPVEGSIPVLSHTLAVELKPYSLTVIRVKLGLPSGDGEPVTNKGAAASWNENAILCLSIEADQDIMGQVITMAQHPSLAYATRDLLTASPQQTTVKLVYTDLPREAREMITRQICAVFGPKVRMDWQMGL